MSSAEDRTKQLRLQQLAADINAGHRKILASIRQSVEQAIETGALLIEAKKLMRRGDWWTWVGDNCEFSYRMSQVYSRLAKHQELVRKTPDHTITTALRAIHDVHACPELAMQVGKGWVKPRPWANTKSVALSGTLRVPRDTKQGRLEMADAILHRVEGDIVEHVMLHFVSRMNATQRKRLIARINAT
jgi:Protein of unknown function (DUF3102)